MTLGLETADGPRSAKLSSLVPAWKAETAQLAAALGWAVAASR